MKEYLFEIICHENYQHHRLTNSKNFSGIQDTGDTNGHLRNPTEEAAPFETASLYALKTTGIFLRNLPAIRRTLTQSKITNLL